MLQCCEGQVPANHARLPTPCLVAFNVLPTIIFFASTMTVLYHLGIMQRVMAFSVVTNAAAGLGDGAIDHEEVMAHGVGEGLGRLLEGLIPVLVESGSPAP